MAHYAYLDENNIVTQVIVGKDEGEDGVDWEDYYGAVRTSYNTRGGVHYDAQTGEPSTDQSRMFRYNYAGVGMVFDPDFGPHGAFYWPRPFPSWILDADKAEWVPPVPIPSGPGPWRWDEEHLQWVAK